MIIAPGQTSVRVHILITTDAGIPVSGLIASTFPAMFYIRDGEARVAITALSDLGAATSGFSANGVFGYGDGHYRIDVPNAAFATASYVKITGEATDKRVFCPIITVRELPSNVRQLAGTTLTVAGNVITLPAGLLLAPTTNTTTALHLAGAPNAYALVLTGGGYETVADSSKGAVLIGVANQQGLPVNAVEILKATASTVAVNVTGTIDANIVGNVTGNVSGSVGSATVVNGLAANIITAASIATDAITAAKLATGAITSAKFAASAIDAAAIAANAITAAKIATGAITKLKFDAGAIDAASIADGAITEFKIADTAITDRKFAANAISAAVLDPDAGTEIAAAVWATTTRQLTATGLALVTAWTTNITGNLSGSVGSVTGAVGSVTGAVGSVTGAVGSVTVVNGLAANIITAASIATDAGTELAAALLDLSDGIETGLTPRGAIRLITAATAGKLSGAATSSIVIRNVGDTKPRITATVDADGNRSAVTTDPT